MNIENKIPRVTVKNDSFGQFGTHVKVNDVEIHGVTSVDFNVSNEMVPTFTIKTKAMPDIDMLGMVYFGFTTETIQQACKVLIHELETNELFYNTFLQGIESALRESTVVWEEWEYTETAKKIVERIIGKG